MKNIYKVSMVLFFGLALTISSCKKDEQIIEGCTNSSAMNYQSLATDNDGSCIYAYDIAQGVWNISSECEDLSITILTQSFDIPLNDMFPDTVEITGEGDGVVAMDINGNLVLADVDNDGGVEIQDGQKISFDTGVMGEVDVDITGSGVISSENNGDFTLNLAFEIPLAGTQNASCDIVFTK